jgi:hypothetical protein
MAAFLLQVVAEAGRQLDHPTGFDTLLEYRVSSRLEWRSQTAIKGNPEPMPGAKISGQTRSCAPGVRVKVQILVEATKDEEALLSAWNRLFSLFRIECRH